MSGLVFNVDLGSVDVFAATARIPGQDAFIDRHQNAQVILGSTPLASFDIAFYSPGFQMGIHTTAGGITLNGNFEKGTKILVDGEEIAVIAELISATDLTSGRLLFTFTDKATAERAAKLISAVTFKDMTGGAAFEEPEVFDIILSDASGEYAYVLMEVGDTVLGTGDADVFTATSSIIGRGDELDGGAGDDILQLNEGGQFYLNRLGKFASIETIQGSDSWDWIEMDSSQWSGLKRIDGEEGANTLILYGSNSDLAHTEILNFSKIIIQDDDATVRVANAAIALLLDGEYVQGEKLIIESGTINPALRLELHNRGFDRIETVEDGHTSIQGAPRLLQFGNTVSASAGDTVFVDKDRDALLDVTREGLDDLRVEIKSAQETETLGIAGSDGLTLTAGLTDLSHLVMRVTTPDGTMHDINFGWLSVSGTGSNIHYVRFKFNQSAKVEWVQQLIRSLTYKNSGEISGDRKLALTIEDVGGRMTAMEVVIKSTEPQPDVNKLPAGLTLSNDAILENSEAGTAIGTLRATDEDGTPLTYTLTGTAEGRFEIRGDKLVVKDGSKIDFENASSHTITVKVSDGEAAVTKDFTIAVTDVREDVPGATRAKNALVGGIGADKINGGSGNDVLTGGLGADVFVFDTVLGRGTTARNHNKKVNFDTITDFKPGEDKIWLDNKIFTKLGRAGSEAAPAALNKKFFKTSKATDKDDYLVYKSGVVYYDADGKGAKYKPVEIIKIANKAALSAADFLVI